VVQGYEKALWFKTDKVRRESPAWSHSEAHEVVGEECRAVRDAAGIIDLSGSARYEITGKDAFAFLDRLSCNRLPTKDGRIGLSLFHAPNGGIMCEMSITRLAEDRFYLVSAIGSEHKDLHWMQQHAGNFEVDITNVSRSIAPWYA
jgi:dimethylglycine dehydrogenase